MIAALGWVAAAALLIAYRGNTTGRLATDGPAYLLLNLLGALGLGVSTAVAHAWPSAVVNGVWLLIGLGPLTRAVRARLHRRTLSVPRASIRA